MKRDFHNKQRRYSKLFFAIYFSSMLGMLSVDAKRLGDILYYDYYTNPNYTTQIPYCEDTIDSYLLENKSLSEVEKEYIRSNFDILDENSDYVNVNSLKLVLPKLKIIYAGDNRDKYKMDSLVKGIYIPSKKSIIMFDCDSFETCDKTTLLHELNHSFGMYKKDNCDSLSEAVNETMRCEYDDTTCFRNRYYQVESLTLYSLCEIIDPKLFIEYHFNGDLTNIKNALNDIVNNPVMTNQLFNNIDNITNIESEMSNELNSDKLNDLYYKYFLNSSNIYWTIKEYFEAKYGYKMEDDPIMNTYLNNGYFMPEQYYLDDDMLCKGYFNDDYIIRNPAPGYYYIGDEVECYILPNDNRVEKDKQKVLENN